MVLVEALLITALLGSAGPLDAAAAEQLYFRAGEAYEAKRYTQATTGYEQLLAAGYEGGDVYYNLGSAYFRSGRLAESIWAWLKASERMPRSEDLAANLNLARRQVTDKLPPRQASATLRTIFFWHYIFSLSERAWILAGANLLLWLLLAMRLRRRDEVISLAVFVLAVITIAVGASIITESLKEHGWGVVKADTTQARSAASADTVMLFELHNGAEFDVESTHNGWVQIRLSDGKRGWLPREQVLLDTDRPEPTG